MGERLRNVTAAAFLAIAASISGCQSACTSVVLAPEPSAADRERAAGTSLPYAVAIEQGEFPPVYAESLAHALRASGLFSKVELADRGDSGARLVARVTSPSEGAAVIPIATALTLGLFPTWAEETWGLGFTLEAPDSAAPPVAIDFRWRGTTVLGWLCALLNLAPGRSGGDPYEGTRYGEHVAAAIAPHASEIEALVSREVARREP